LVLELFFVVPLRGQTARESEIAISTDKSALAQLVAILEGASQSPHH
jgi:hypothetical protein